MRTFIAIVALMITLILSSCSLSRGSNAMLANGKQMKPVPWLDANKTQVEVDLNIKDFDDDSPSPTEMEAKLNEIEAKFNAGPWWIWPANAETLRLGFGRPELWDSSVHGMYTTKTEDVTTDSKLKTLFTKQRLIKPDQVGDSNKWLEYKWNSLESLMATDSNYESDHLFYMVVTPYEKGCYIVCTQDKLNSVNK